jgi:2-oxoglutarate dehydrogenase E1 component
MFCSGKVFYDLRAERESRGDFRSAIVRVEQLYPFPHAALRSIVAGYPRALRALWVQEEPRNMGAWSFVRERSAEFLPDGFSLAYAGRAPSPSPATGNAGVHKQELESLLSEAFGA